MKKKQTFPDRLKLSIDNKKTTALDLANQAGFDPSLISHFLHGRKTPSISTLKIIADILEVDPGWLMFGKSKYGNPT